MPLDNRLRMAITAASDGPRIMLFGPLTVDLKALQECFECLRDPMSSVQLADQPFVNSYGRVRVLARNSAAAVGMSSDVRQGIRRISDLSPDFVWTRTAEGWDYLARLLDGLMQHPGPSHQYLTRYPGEDAIVVVSKGEYDDDVLLKLFKAAEET